MQSAVIYNKCTAYCARFLFRNKISIIAHVWQAQLAVIRIYNIFILHFSAAKVRVREFAQLSCYLTTLEIIQKTIRQWIQPLKNLIEKY